MQYFTSLFYTLTYQLHVENQWPIEAGEICEGETNCSLREVLDGFQDLGNELKSSHAHETQILLNDICHVIEESDVARF